MHQVAVFHLQEITRLCIYLHVIRMIHQLNLDYVGICKAVVDEEQVTEYIVIILIGSDDYINSMYSCESFWFVLLSINHGYYQTV